MTDKSVEILIAGVTTPEEIDNYQEDEDRRALFAIYESSTFDILDSMNKETFYDTYSVLKNDILSMSDTMQKIFIDKYLDQMLEVYNFEFSPKLIYDTQMEIGEMFKFIEFVEYDNLTVLSYVWKYLEDIIKVDIDKYVRKKYKIIIDEITNQANLLTTITENDSEFLRTYDKEGIIEWFIDRSKRNKYNIFAENVN
jgi:hypothetical protein